MEGAKHNVFACISHLRTWKSYLRDSKKLQSNCITNYMKNVRETCHLLFYKYCFATNEIVCVPL